MYSAAVLVALAGSTIAQGTYNAAACPAAGETSSDGRYSCNPARSYPAGQVCTLSDGCYYLRTEAPGVTATPSESVVAPTYGGTSSAAKSSSSVAACPAPGTTAADGRYSCNPARSYPAGQVCTLSDGCYYLRTEVPGVTATPSVSVDVPEYRTSTPSAPSSSASCPAPGTNAADGRYSCNPARSYPAGQVCTLSDGCYYLRTEAPGVTATPSVSVGVPVYRTTTVSAITTYCPQPTTFVHSASTYVVTKATTLTVPCPGGCVVTEAKTVPATTAPGTTAPVYKTGSTMVPSANKNETATHTIATYTGAGAMATGAPLAAMAALGAFFL